MKYPPSQQFCWVPAFHGYVYAIQAEKGEIAPEGEDIAFHLEEAIGEMEKGIAVCEGKPLHPCDEMNVRLMRWGIDKARRVIAGA